MQLPVSDLQEALEQDANGHKVFSAPDGECKVDVAILEIVAAHSL